MKTQELILALQQLEVPVEYYSILEGLKPDAIVLDHFHGLWKVFYFSERGETSDERVFASEEEACSYIFNRFKRMKENTEKSIKEHNSLSGKQP